jgi:hypothetical protein
MRSPRWSPPAIREWSSLRYTVATIICLPTAAFAANQYAEAGAKWILDGIFWIVLVVGIFGAGMSAVKRNAIASVGIIIGTAIICVFCQNPEIIVNIGNVLKGILGL